ncbi:MAG: hypothetical protein WCJ26_06975 [bacterium]
MKRKVTLSLLVLLPAISGFAAWERHSAGGRSHAMGGTSVTACDLWSLSNNQAGTAWLKGFTAGVSFENHFLLKELMFEQVGVAFPVKAGTFGLVVNRYGNNQYNEIKAGFSFSRKFGKHFSIGIQLDYLRIHISNEYGNKNLISCETGLIYKADKHLTVGIQVLNPVPVRISRYPAEQLPTSICIGISYRFSEVFVTDVEAEKDLENPVAFRAGAEYHFVGPAYARIGISTSPMSFSFGFGLEFGKIKLDMASGYHQALGFSPSGSMIYSFK